MILSVAELELEHRQLVPEPVSLMTVLMVATDREESQGHLALSARAMSFIHSVLLFP